MADIIIKNGRLFDPVEKLDMTGDLVIEKGVIKKLGTAPEGEKADLTIDAEGRLVTAGWIDIHGHLYDGGTPNGLPIDMAAIPMGVTAIADAGSSGVANYHNLLQYLRRSRIRAKLMLNVSACGIIMPSQFPEPLDPGVWSMKLFRDAKEACGSDMMGLKIRASKGIISDLTPLRKAVEAAQELGTRVIVHATNPAESMEAVAECLRPGDVLCHVYQGDGSTILAPDGTIKKEIMEARARGVIFDAASGRGNFSFRVARAATEQGFLPDSISTDVTLQNWNHPLAGALPTVMSKYLDLGLEPAQIIERVTAGPAVQFGMDGLGALREGTPADITISALEDRKTVYKDKFGDTAVCDKLFIPKATIIGGKVQYRSVDCRLV